MKWNASNAKSCSVTSPVAAAQPITGTYGPVTLTSTTVFTMTCVGAHTNVTKSLTVTVAPLDCNSAKAIVSNASTGEIWTDNRSSLGIRSEALRNAGYNLPRFYNPWYNGGDGINIYADAETIKKSCNMLGYANGTGINMGKHKSPNDNAVMKWNTANKTYDLLNSKNYNYSAFTINCTGKLNPVCYNDAHWIFK